MRTYHLFVVCLLCRSDLSKTQLQELASACKDMYSRQVKAGTGAAGGAAGAEQQASKGWKFWK
jgi:hypothetical protein